MKMRMRPLGYLLRRTIEAGRSVILALVCIEIGLLAITFVVGLIGWMKNGPLFALVYGMISFGVGEALAVILLEIKWQQHERSNPAQDFSSH